MSRHSVAPFGVLLAAACLLLPLCSLQLVVGQSPVTTSFTYQSDATLLNPLRGFAAYYDNLGGGVFPTTLEYSYVPLKKVMTNAGTRTFDWSFVESMLVATSRRGHHAILRLYVDYPACCAGPDADQYESAVPPDLTTGPGAVTFTAYSDHGGGSSPDYSNARLVTAFEDAIAAFGARYDGDARIACIQLGLLGFWGEWHTYGDSANLPALTPPRATQTRVLAAYNQAFTKTRLLVSQDEMIYWDPSGRGAPVTTTYKHIGWHDDAFGEATYDPSAPEDWFFYNRLVSHGVLDSFAGSATAPPRFMGGEVYPDLQSTMFKPTGYTGQPFAPAAANTHVSWLLNNELFEARSASYHTAAKAASLLLGYQFTVSSAQFTAPASCPQCQQAGTPAWADNAPVGGQCLCTNAQITVVNKGNAPFPYALTLVVRNGGTGAVAASIPATSDTVNGADSQAFNTRGGGSSFVVSTTLYWRTEAGASGTARDGLFVLRLTSPHVLDNQLVRFANAENDLNTGALPMSAPATAARVSDSSGPDSDSATPSDTGADGVNSSTGAASTDSTSTGAPSSSSGTEFVPTDGEGNLNNGAGALGVSTHVSAMALLAAGAIHLL